MRLSDPRSVVAAKRDGHPLDAADIESFIEGYTAGEVSDALASAFLMAVVIRGLDDEEMGALTRAMIASGETLAFEGLGVPLIDKHSTGGVADGVTLVFAPLAAAPGTGRGQAVRTRARTHGRDAGQAGVHPRRADRPDPRGTAAAGRRHRVRGGRPDAATRPRGRRAVRPARRHGHRALRARSSRRA